MESKTVHPFADDPTSNSEEITVKPPVLHTQVVLDKAEEIVEEIIDAASEQNPLTVWMRSISPILKQGGKPTAIILALGTISIPLMLLGGGLWVAPILALGACVVAIRAMP